MKYLVIDTPTERHVVRRKTRSSLGYEEMRTELTRLYPDRAIASPIDPGIPGGALVAMYLSGAEDGVGRSGSGVFHWMLGQ